MKKPAELGVHRAPDRTRCDIVEPPDFLRGKVVKGSGLGADEVERRAHAAIDAMREDYLLQANQDLGRIERSLAKVRLSSGHALAEGLQDVLWIAHEMRGQAGTFDYELITTIGSEMCRYIEDAEAPAAVSPQVLAVYVDTMRAVISGEVIGDGGSTGETLLGSMEAMLARLGKSSEMTEETPGETAGETATEALTG